MRGLTRRWWVLAASGVLVAGVIGQAAADPTPPAGAAPAGGDPVSALLDSVLGNHDDAFRNGCRNNFLGPTDDGSSTAVALPFKPNFFGQRTQLFVNNNGNVTFDGPRSAFNFADLDTGTHPMIAPFLADVDTRALGQSQGVTYGVSSDQKTFCADWGGVGYYDNHGDKLDKFRLLLIDRSGDQGNSPGDFDIVMDYDSIQWDKADAKAPGVAAVARVGYSKGTGLPNTSFQLPGSGTPGAFVDNGPNSLADHSLITSDQRATAMRNGSYVFAVRNGQPLPTGHPPVVTEVPGLNTPEDTPLHVTVPTSDPENDMVVLRSATDGAHGTVTCTTAAPIQCTYTPAANFNGPDSFRVNVTDSHGNNATGTESLVVTPVNDAPTVVSPQTMTVSLTTPPTPVTRNVLTGASDPDGDTVTVSSLTPLAAHGTVACTAAGSCTYTPNATFTTGLTDSFTFTAGDGHGGTATGTVNISEHNDKPTAAFEAQLQTPTTPLVVAFNAAASHDPQGPIATYAWDFGDGSTGTGVNPTHTYAQPGSYQVKLTVTDSGGLTDSTTRSVRLRNNPQNGGGNNGPGGGGNNGPGGGGNNGPGGGGNNGPVGGGNNGPGGGGNNGPGGGGNNGPGGGNHGPGRGDGPRDHGPDHGRGDYGHGGNRDYLELVNDTGHGYSVHGTPRHGDFRVERDGDRIRRISGTGYFDDGTSVTFRLRVRHDHAYGTITVRDRDRVLDRFRVDGVRITEHGDTVEGRARYQGGGGRFYFVIEDRY
jgi:PKD repeat protein